MAEYIDRDLFIQWLREFRPDDPELVSAVINAPAADVTPVRHGKWRPFHAEFAGDIQYCSVCEIGFADRTSFCPHCGARMTEDIDEQKK